MSKAKIIGWVIASPFILIAGGIAFCEANKAYWDHQVKQMCEKDGGVTVYEKVELTKEEYESLKIPFDKDGKFSTPYYRVTTEYVVISGYPKVGKSGQIIVRRSDKKTLGMLTHYGRGGGDAIPIDHPSHYGCENIDGINNNLTNSVFTVRGQ